MWQGRRDARLPARRPTTNWSMPAMGTTSRSSCNQTCQFFKMESISLHGPEARPFGCLPLCHFCFPRSGCEKSAESIGSPQPDSLCALLGCDTSWRLLNGNTGHRAVFMLYLDIRTFSLFPFPTGIIIRLTRLFCPNNYTSPIYLPSTTNAPRVRNINSKVSHRIMVNSFDRDERCIARAAQYGCL